MQYRGGRFGKWWERCDFTGDIEKSFIGFFVCVFFLVPDSVANRGISGTSTEWFTGFRMLFSSVLIKKRCLFVF